MMEKIRLGDLVEFQRGYDLPKNEFKNGKIPVISSNGILGYHNEVKIKEIGITIGRSGTVGFPHLIKQDFFPHNTTLFIKNFNGNNVVYIYYLLKSLNLNEYKSGSGVPTINRNHLHPLKVTATKNKETQQKIAKILSDIDDKIEILHQINDNLAELAKTIYDYWFVQFDFPDENGKPYKTSGGKMVYNEVLKREIPEGWEVKKLGEVIEKISNNILPTEYQNLNYLPIDFLPKRQFYYDKYDLRENALSSLIKFDEDDILLGAMRVYFHRVCNAIEDGISRNTIFVLRPFEKENKNYCLFLLDEEKTIQFANDNSTGSSIPYAKWDNGLANYQLVLPKKNILSLFNLKINPIIKKLKINSKQIQHLRSLRDWLLPMLMNGQISVE
jgi:restriction modification system DNA specificity subunit